MPILETDIGLVTSEEFETHQNSEVINHADGSVTKEKLSAELKTELEGKVPKENGKGLYPVDGQGEPIYPVPDEIDAVSRSVIEPPLLQGIILTSTGETGTPGRTNPGATNCVLEEFDFYYNGMKQTPTLSERTITAPGNESWWRYLYFDTALFVFGQVTRTSGTDTRPAGSITIGYMQGTSGSNTYTGSVVTPVYGNEVQLNTAGEIVDYAKDNPRIATSSQLGAILPGKGTTIDALGRLRSWNYETRTCDYPMVASGYTITASDDGKFLILSNLSSPSFPVSIDASLPVGFECIVMAYKSSAPSQGMIVSGTTYRSTYPVLLSKGSSGSVNVTPFSQALIASSSEPGGVYVPASSGLELAANGQLNSYHAKSHSLMYTTGGSIAMTNADQEYTVNFARGNVSGFISPNTTYFTDISASTLRCLRAGTVRIEREVNLTSALNANSVLTLRIKKGGTEIAHLTKKFYGTGLSFTARFVFTVAANDDMTLMVASSQGSNVANYLNTRTEAYYLK